MSLRGLYCKIQTTQETNKDFCFLFTLERFATECRETKTRQMTYSLLSKSREVFNLLSLFQNQTNYQLESNYLITLDTQIKSALYMGNPIF